MARGFWYISIDMQIHRCLIFLLLLLPILVPAQSDSETDPKVEEIRVYEPPPRQYKLIWDQWMSGRASGEGLFTLHHAWTTFEHRHIPLTFNDETSAGNKLLGIGYRATKLASIDFLVDYLTVITTHEVFGHGFRYREMRFENNSFSVRLPPPLGVWGGFARRGNRTVNSRTGIHEDIAMTLAGSEGSRQLSNLIRDHWVESRRYSYREALLYLTSFHDFTGYLFTTPSTIGSGDPSLYLRQTNGAYGFNDPTSYPLSLEKVKRQNLLNLLNTWSMMSIYTLSRDYLWKGKDRSRLPTLSFRYGPSRHLYYLPSLRTGFAPFGMEWYGEHFFWLGRYTFQVSHRHGDGRLAKWSGFGLHLFDLIKTQRLWMGVEADAWNQPELILTDGPTAGGWGGSLKVSGGLTLHNSLGLHLSLGYKTAGYLEGEVLDASPIIRLGLMLRTHD